MPAVIVDGVPEYQATGPSAEATLKRARRIAVASVHATHSATSAARASGVDQPSCGCAS